MHRLRTVTSFDVSAVAGHHAMPAALLFGVKSEFIPRQLHVYVHFHTYEYHSTKY